MAYDEKLADRVREHLADVANVEEKKMFSGVTFMVNDKMCISVGKNGLMCRIDPEMTDELLELNWVRPMVMRGKTLKGYIYVDENAVNTQKELDYWIKLCLEYNPKANKAKNRT